MKRTLLISLTVHLLAWAGGNLPDGWRDLKFGMPEKQVEKKILEYRTKADRDWEQTGLTAMYVPDPAAKRLAMRDLDSEKYQQWMIGHLNEGAATTRTFFANGKLIAVQVMGTVDFNTYVKKAAQAYGQEPERAKWTVTNETSTGKPSDTKELEVALWRGPRSTAIIFQPSGWGPELFVISNPALTAVNASLQKAGTPAESATEF